MAHTSSQANALTVSQLRKVYASPAGGHEVLKGVDLAVEPGQTVAIVGASGCGKSTLLNIIGSLDQPTSGTVRLGGLEVSSLEGDRLAEFRRRRVGFVFQDHHLLPQCTAIENVALPAVAAEDGAGGLRRAAELLARVGLKGREDDFPQRLSGGERQRVAVARALVNDPPLLLCDEPTGNLDRATAEPVAALFAELAAERSVMLIVVTHNLELARRFSRCLELRDGRLQPADRA
ncbi:MAG: ABC transporter ATP-binding protein [Planctomycetes bacterium]|nr:ABC transporter ATP-binding protein [Planctomycetota bacterium]